jgi:SAM-dependent methyltransferase
MHDAVWERVPAGATPERFELRRAFLLDRARAGETVPTSAAVPASSARRWSRPGRRRSRSTLPVRRCAVCARLPSLDARLWEPGQALPVEDASIDVVWAGEVIEHVADVAPWLSELRRVLKPRGTLPLTTPHHGPGTLMRLALRRRAFAAHFEPRSDHVQYFSPRTMRELLDGLGFDTERIRTAGGVPGLRTTILAQATRG